MKKLLQRLKTHASAAVVAIAAIGSSAALTNEAEAATFDWEAGTVTVEAGDLMSRIAGRQLSAFGVEGFNYTHFAHANNMTLEQANHINVGQVLLIPAEAVAAYFEANPPIAVAPVEITLSASVLAQQEYMLALDAQEDAAATVTPVEAGVSPSVIAQEELMAELDASEEAALTVPAQTAPAVAPDTNPLTAAQEALAAQTTAEAAAETARIALEAAEGDKARVLAEVEEAQRALDEATSALEAAQAAHDQAVAANEDITVTQAALEAAQAAHASAETSLSGANVAYSAVEEAAEAAQAAHVAATQAAAEAAAETARLSVVAVSGITADSAICVAGDATGSQTTCEDVLVSESDAAGPVAAMFDNLDQARNAEIQGLQDAYNAEQEKLAALEAAHAEANAISEAALQALVDTNCAEAVQDRVRAVADAAAAERLADIEAARAALVTMQSEIDALVEADAAAELEAEEILADVCDKDCETAVDLPPVVTPPVVTEVPVNSRGLCGSLTAFGNATGQYYLATSVFENNREDFFGDNIQRLRATDRDGNPTVLDVTNAQTVETAAEVCDVAAPPPPVVRTTTGVVTSGGTTTVAEPRPVPQACSVRTYRDSILNVLTAVKTQSPAGSYECCVTEVLPVGQGGRNMTVWQAPSCSTGGGGGNRPDPTPDDNGHSGGCSGGCGTPGRDPDPNDGNGDTTGGPGNPGGPAGAGAASGADSSGDAGGQGHTDASVLREHLNNAFAALDVPADPLPLRTREERVVVSGRQLNIA